jgi:hypothetical protein
LGQEYLVVSSDCFGVYRLNDVKYNDGVIQMVLTNKTNGNWAQICMDINDKHPKYFLVCWKDIKEMVYNDNNGIPSSFDELLELDAGCV